MTIKDADVSEMLQKLQTNSGLQLKVEENESGFSLLLMDGNRVKEMLGFSNTKTGIYMQLLTTNRVIAAMLYKQSGLKPL
jgi:hypothetical protein